MGQQALLSKDVPVASILTYQNSIIGVGYNTFKKYHDLGRHAEINAMNMAYQNYGETFYKLDREQLIL